MTNPNNAAHIAALRDLRLGVEMDRHNLEDGDVKLAALDAAISSLSKLRAPVADERAALTHQDIYDRFQFLEGLVNEQRYKQIAETAIAIYESGAPWAAMADTIRDLRAELGYVAQYGKRELPNMCPPATSRDRWMYEQGRLAERAALASAPVAGEARPVAWRYLNEKSRSWNMTTSSVVADAMRESGRAVESLYAAPQASEAVRDALWTLTEHNALHFGEQHNTVIQGRAALSAQPGAQRTGGGE